MKKHFIIITVSVVVFLILPLVAAGRNFGNSGAVSARAPGRIYDSHAVSADGSSLIYKGSDVPVILPRSTWENSSSLKKLLRWFPEENAVEGKLPDYAPVKRIVIHDTGCNPARPGCNDDELDPITVIQGIYRYHAVTRGWGDIGYHYIIDRQGRIYEGRYGGNGVRGGHLYYDRKCQNFNHGTVGISVLGNYSSEDATAASYRSLIRLVGWISAANNLDPRVENFTTKVWQNPVIGEKKCDFSKGSFSANYTGPVVVGHGDIEKGNSDPGLIDLNKIRKQAYIEKLAYEKNLYNAKGNSAAYTINNGRLRKIAADISKVKFGQGVVWRKAVELLKTQLDYFPSEAKYVYDDGALLKSYTRDEIYLVEAGKRKRISSDSLFNKRGFDWNKITEISDRELAGYPIGAPVLYPDGSLIKGGGEEVYLVEGGKRRHITSAPLFKIMNLKWQDIITLTDRELSHYPIGKKYLLSDNSLVKGPGPTVYLVERGRKKRINSARLFNLKGYKWDDIVNLNKKELAVYPDGGIVLYPDNTLIKPEGGTKVYIVRSGKRYWIKTLEAFNSLKLKWEDVVSLSSSDVEYYVLGSAINSAADFLNIGNKNKAVAPAKEEPKKVPVSGSSAPLVSEPLIKIGIFSAGKGDKVTITANGDYQVFKNGNLLSDKPKDAETDIVLDNIEGVDYKFVPSKENVIMEISSYNNVPSWNKSINYNKFRGSILVKYSSRSKKVWVINEIKMEDYLKGIGEALNTDHIEYLKAFSVASRSYALFHLNNGGKREGEIYHLNNTPSDQVYKGYQFEILTPNITAAVNATKGEVAVYQGKPIRSVYSSDSGGVTKSACSVFKGIFCTDSWYGYLKGGVKDPEGTEHIASKVAASHGVGMSAIGGRRLAELGKKYKEILKYYYFGIEIEKQY